MSLAIERNFRRISLQPGFLTMVSVSSAVLTHYIIIGLGLVFNTGYGKDFVHVVNSNILSRFMQWDSIWYYMIGKYGYHVPLAAQLKYHASPFTYPLSTAAYFPGLPLVIHLLGPVGALAAGNLIFVASIVLLFKLCHGATKSHSTASLTVMLYALNPATIYDSSLYTEVYVIFLSMLVVYSIQKEEFIWDLLACVSVLFLGEFHELGCLGIVFGIRYIREKRYVWALVFATCAGGGWVADIAYFAIKYGQPFAMFNAERQPYWTRGWRFPGTNLIQAVHDKVYYDVFFLVLFLLLAVGLIMYVVRTTDGKWSPNGAIGMLSIESATWVALYCILNLCTYTSAPTPTISVIRFFSVLWPLYTVPTLTLTRLKEVPALQSSLVAMFAISALWGTILYTHGYFYQ